MHKLGLLDSESTCNVATGGQYTMKIIHVTENLFYYFCQDHKYVYIHTLYTYTPISAHIGEGACTDPNLYVEVYG